MTRTKQKVHQIKTTWTEEEFAQLQEMAQARKIPLGVCVHSLVCERLRTHLTRGETILLEAIVETKANHADVIRLSLEKKLSLAALNALAEENARRRRELAQEFLLAVPAVDDTPEPDENDTEDEQEEEE